jgi:hypothetical protein
MSPEKENLVTVGCKITADEMELLDARAEKAGLSRSEYMRRVIQTAVAQDLADKEPASQDPQYAPALGIRAEFTKPGHYSLIEPKYRHEIYILGLCTSSDELTKAIEKALDAASDSDALDGSYTKRNAD